MPPGDPAARPSNFGSASVVTAAISRSLSMRRLAGCAWPAGARLPLLRRCGCASKRPATWNQINAVATMLRPMTLRLFISASRAS